MAPGPRPQQSDVQAQVVRARNGDREATEVVIASHLGFIIYIAKKLRGRGVSLEDLVAEGCVGLLKAIRAYSVTNGARFLSYASFWVRKEMLAACSEQPYAVRVPRWQREKGHRPPIVLRLDHPTDANRDGCLAEKMTHPAPLPVDAMLEYERIAQVRRHVKRLAPREQTVIDCRYGLSGKAPQTLREIADRLDVSRERVRAIELNALLHLRDALEGRPRRRRGRRPNAITPPGP
jgi:RNA polymerase sigma factor (sigma-70 family)